MEMAQAKMSWTKVAPDRNDTGKNLNHCSIDPVTSITRIDAPIKIALSFWPGLYLSASSLDFPNVRSQRISSRVQKLMRRISWRIAVPHGPIREMMIGSARERPVQR